MDNETTTRRAIMNRVYGVYVVRTLLAPRTRYAGLAIAALAISVSVSLEDVFANALSAASTPGGFFYYVLDAVTTTEATVQIFVLIIAVSVALMVRDLFRLCISQNMFGVQKTFS